MHGTVPARHSRRRRRRRHNTQLQRSDVGPRTGSKFGATVDGMGEGGGGPCGSSGFQDTITLLEDLVAGRARYGLEDPPPLPPRGAVR